MSATKRNVCKTTEPSWLGQRTIARMSNPSDEIGERTSAASATDDPIEREVAFLAELERLAALRSAAQTQIEAQHRARVTAATRTFEETRRSVRRSPGDGARRDMASDYSEQRRHATSRCATRRRWPRKPSRTCSKTSSANSSSIRSAPRRLKDSRWEAETLYEAARHTAPKRLAEFEGLVETWLARVRSEGVEAAHLLLAWSQASPIVTSPVELSVAGDPLVRMQERVNFAIAQRQQLAALRLPPAVAGPSLIWGGVLVGMSLAAVSVAIGWGAVPAVALFCVSSAVGIGLRFFLRRKAAASIAEIYPALCQAVVDAEALGGQAVNAARKRAAAEQAEVVARRERALNAANDEYHSRLDVMNHRRNERLNGPALDYPHQIEQIAERRDRDFELAEEIRGRRDAEIRLLEAGWPAVEERHRRQLEQFDAQHASGWNTLVERCARGWRVRRAPQSHSPRRTVGRRSVAGRLESTRSRRMASRRRGSQRRAVWRVSRAARPDSQWRADRSDFGGRSTESYALPASSRSRRNRRCCSKRAAKAARWPSMPCKP